MSFQDDGAACGRQCGLEIAAAARQTLPVRAGFFFAVFCFVCACDDGVRAAHRADAIDVAGRYVDAAAGVVLVVEDEADKNDVQLTFARDAVPDVEVAFVARAAGLDARVVVVGAGPDGVRDEAVGGENVSVDGGASTVVDCDGDDVDADGGVLRWSARLVGDAAGLAGVLRLSLRERRPRAGDVDGASTEAASVATALAFVRADDAADP